MKLTTYVALLRGINVGGNNKVSMPQLKKAFEHLGFEHVTTYINSGNIIFQAKPSKTLVTKIEAKIRKEFGFSVKVLVKDLPELKKICAKIPSKWTNDAEQRTDVIFLWDTHDKKTSLKLIKTNPDVDNLMYAKGAIVWNLKKSDYTKSRMNKFIGTEVYKNMTARNVNTTRKLLAMMSEKLV